MISVGIDLAGVPSRPTGFCVMNGDRLSSTFVIHSDEEIMEFTLREKPDVVAIDAPLALPHGRESLDVPGTVHFRECDLELRKMGIRFFPLTLGPMRKLTQRGILLKAALEKSGLSVVETYPGASQDILNIPRKGQGLLHLLNGLRSMGISGLSESNTGDELDAATCALAGILFLKGEHQAIGNPSEMLMILPRNGVARSRADVHEPANNQGTSEHT